MIPGLSCGGIVKRAQPVSLTGAQFRQLEIENLAAINCEVLPAHYVDTDLVMWHPVLSP
jgi:hypothetical protein